MPRAQDAQERRIHMEKVRPGTGREAGLDHVRHDAFQDATKFDYKTITL
jgi:hypothetical protein